MNLESFYKLTYGLYIVSSHYENHDSGFICNAVMQVTSTPCQVIIVSNNSNYTTELIRQSKRVGISAIGEDISREVIGLFGYKSGREIEKFSHIAYKRQESGIPIVTEGTLAWFEGEVIGEKDLGTHTMFLANIKQCELTDNKHNPLTYKYYREVLKGKSPKSAPTYIADEEGVKEAKSINNNKTKKEGTMNNEGVWVCDVCGYKYDPMVGDPDSGILPGTAFEDIPDDWVCPLCGVDKSNFVKA